MQGQGRKAGQCYEDVINRFANAGPFVLDALRGAEELLGDDRRRVLTLYQQAWNRINRPPNMAGVFFRQTNWYRVGDRYGQRLQEAGLHTDAARVWKTIGKK